MSPDALQEAWQSRAPQARLSSDAGALLNEVRRSQSYFDAMIFWRDLREVGVSLALIPAGIYLGVRFALPWTWYLVFAAVAAIGAHIFIDRIRYRQEAPDPGEPLRRHVERSLGEVDHQIRLLRRLLRWNLLPLGLACLAFFGQTTWQHRDRGELAAFTFLLSVGITAFTLAAVYWLNQYAIRADLEPRRAELQALLAGLGDEAAPREPI